MIASINDWQAEKQLVNYYTFQANLWGKDAYINVSLKKAKEDLNVQEKDQLIKLLTKEIQWIEKSKTEFCGLMLEEGILALAEDWTCAAEEVEGKAGCYKIDGQEVQLPITKQVFEESLYFNGVGFEMSEDLTKYDLTLYIECSPDYFAGHAIEVWSNQEHCVTVGSLVG
ncbi:DUF2262 domain-containing protein [Enterococcus sp. LJL128]